MADIFCMKENCIQIFDRLLKESVLCTLKKFLLWLKLTNDLSMAQTTPNMFGLFRVFVKNYSNIAYLFSTQNSPKHTWGMLRSVQLFNENQLLNAPEH